VIWTHNVFHGTGWTCSLRTLSPLALIKLWMGTVQRARCGVRELRNCGGRLGTGWLGCRNPETTVKDIHLASMLVRDQFYLTIATDRSSSQRKLEFLVMNLAPFLSTIGLQIQLSRALMWSSGYHESLPPVRKTDEEIGLDLTEKDQYLGAPIRRRQFVFWLSSVHG